MIYETTQTQFNNRSFLFVYSAPNQRLVRFLALQQLRWPQLATSFLAVWIQAELAFNGKQAIKSKRSKKWVWKIQKPLCSLCAKCCRLFMLKAQPRVMPVLCRIERVDSSQVCLHSFSVPRVKNSPYIVRRVWWGERAVPCVLYFTQPAAHALQSADLLTRLSLWWPLLSGSSYFMKMASLYCCSFIENNH